MKQFATLTFGLFFLLQFTIAQNQNPTENIPYIEVTGHAEKKIIPDEIYLSITIKERENGRDQITIEQQEKDLRQALIALNIPIENLSISDANADYIRIKWNKRDVVSQSEYELKLSTAQQVVDVFEKLDEMKIDNASILRVSHSKLKDFQKELYIEAIQNAKAKANYLLAAIGQQTGTALIVYEKSSNLDNHFVDRHRILRENNASMRYAQYSNDDKYKQEINFRSYQLNFSIYVKFEIK